MGPATGGAGTGGIIGQRQQGGSTDRIAEGGSSSPATNAMRGGYLLIHMAAGNSHLIRYRNNTRGTGFPTWYTATLRHFTVKPL